MGITKKTIFIYKCDLCKAECAEDDTRIKIELNKGDGRDVGPAYLHGTLRVNQPYGTDNGIVCKQCKFTWLKKYLSEVKENK